MRLLIDMNLSPKLESLFEDAEFPCLHWSNVGVAQEKDEMIFAWARKNNCVLFTNDSDFCRILAFSHQIKPSVVLVRRKNLLPDALFPELIGILRKYKDELEQGSLIVLDESKIRIKILPF